MQILLQRSISRLRQKPLVPSVAINRRRWATTLALLICAPVSSISALIWHPTRRRLASFVLLTITTAFGLAAFLSWHRFNSSMSGAGDTFLVSMAGLLTIAWQVLAGYWLALARWHQKGFRRFTSAVLFAATTMLAFTPIQRLHTELARELQAVRSDAAALKSLADSPATPAEHAAAAALSQIQVARDTGHDYPRFAASSAGLTAANSILTACAAGLPDSCKTQQELLDDKFVGTKDSRRLMLLWLVGMRQMIPQG